MAQFPSSLSPHLYILYSLIFLCGILLESLAISLAHKPKTATPPVTITIYLACIDVFSSLCGAQWTCRSKIKDQAHRQSFLSSQTIVLEQFASFIKDVNISWTIQIETEDLSILRVKWPVRHKKVLVLVMHSTPDPNSFVTGLIYNWSSLNYCISTILFHIIYLYYESRKMLDRDEICLEKVIIYK